MIEKLDHINLTATNLKESVDWYANVFELKTMEEGKDSAGRPYAIVGWNDTMLCIYEEYKKRADELLKSDYHEVSHFGFRIKDKKKWENKLKDLNLELYYGGEIKYPRSISWYVRDPSGHEIEVSYTEQGLWI